ncbi:flagellar attachment zone protein 1-like isoform X3 [Palaemon carinicauda]|uniref:flagellar attachment zone protein 1-like isoform X3 n=1 Tax=Palaemon carinicauda TaxID=392227 RepID=UPI0035B59857
MPNDAGKFTRFLETQQVTENLSVTIQTGYQQLEVTPPEIETLIEETQKVTENLSVTIQTGYQQSEEIPPEIEALIEETQKVTENPPVAFENGNQQLEVGPGPAEGTPVTSKKRKFLWEQKEPFDDPKEERKRKNAIKARINREKKIAENETLSKKLEQKDKEIKNLKESLATAVKENKILKKLLVERLRVLRTRKQTPQP